ncbi:hypothetical protein THASP1DRAFT_30051 [Thamnocephalis sphaerospora]|uniref:Uncharacterized protein n=1 Tax=Thamnocephalis sphaerospora TaxID=78915 RepID=A0A4P9XQ29_9FUNG|nr:hypothetical protein THASP1DRAFT_30051 [Thamnocephalis sphaerospora]|eukprot:RKP08134.1 hypothetical protein THASP1DRAFT_30051 [Thamnocephalis sphaerospora]
MQACEAGFLEWCARTATKQSDAKINASLVTCWGVLDWRDMYRRRVCTERNWKQSRYIRRVYAFPQIPGYKSYEERADGWFHGTSAHASAATIHLTSKDGREKSIVDHTYGLDGDCVPDTEQRRSESQRELDAQSPTSLNLVYFNNEYIRARNRPELLDELQTRLQRDRGRHPHLDELYDAAYNVLGKLAGCYKHNHMIVSWGCWNMFVVLNGRGNCDIIARNIVYKTTRKELLDTVPHTRLAIIRAALKSVVIYMASLEKEGKNMRWRLVEIFTDQPFKTICSGVVRLELETACKIDYVFPIVEHGSERVNRVGARISLVSPQLSHMCEAIVHDISASTAANAPVLPLLKKSVQACGITRLPGGFAFVQDNQIICPVEKPTQCAKIQPYDDRGVASGPGKSLTMELGSSSKKLQQIGIISYKPTREITAVFDYKHDETRFEYSGRTISTLPSPHPWISGDIAQMRLDARPL